MDEQVVGNDGAKRLTLNQRLSSWEKPELNQISAGC